MLLITAFSVLVSIQVFQFQFIAFGSGNNRQTQSIYFSHTTVGEICSIVKELKNKTSIGFDVIDVNI